MCSQKTFLVCDDISLVWIQLELMPTADDTVCCHSTLGNLMVCITVVEGLSNKRQAHPDKEAIYFISPTLDSVRAAIDDYSKTRPPYAAAHVFTTSALSDQLFERIQHSPAINHLRTCKELNIDFFGMSIV